MDRLHELKVGQKDTLSRRITAEDVVAFARLSGDYNALHLDDEFAARTEFSQRVVHGFLHASLLSTLVGTKLPGKGALYLSQSIEFTKPVFIGDVVHATGVVQKIDINSRLITLAMEIAKEDGTCVLRGTAQVKVLKLCEGEAPASRSQRRPGAGLLEGKVALVTGASRGIGRSIARLFAEHGALVWINYHRSATAAEQLEKEIGESGGRCRPVRADLTDEADVRGLAELVGAEGRLDVLVNNAGPKIKSAPFADLKWLDLSSSYEQIVGGVFMVTQSLLPALKESQGQVINIVTSAALGRTAFNWLPYVAAKGALLAMSKNLAQELGPQGVRVNMISPSMTDTDLVASTHDRVRQAFVSRTPLRRLATADDVAGAALMLASPYSSFITGENLLVTGGETMI